MAGPGDYDLTRTRSPGTQQFDCVLAPAGHLMLPCAEFQSKQTNSQRGRLQLTPQLALPVETTPTAAEQVSEVRPPRGERSQRTRWQVWYAPL